MKIPKLKKGYDFEPLESYGELLAYFNVEKIEDLSYQQRVIAEIIMSSGICLSKIALENTRTILWSIFGEENEQNPKFKGLIAFSGIYSNGFDIGNHINFNFLVGWKQLKDYFEILTSIRGRPDTRYYKLYYKRKEKYRRDGFLWLRKKAYVPESEYEKPLAPVLAKDFFSKVPKGFENEEVYGVFKVGSMGEWAEDKQGRVASASFAVFCTKKDFYQAVYEEKKIDYIKFNEKDLKFLNEKVEDTSAREEYKSNYTVGLSRVGTVWIDHLLKEEE